MIGYAIRTLFICIIGMSLWISNSLHAANMIFVGIAGGTGSGKTTLAKKIQHAFGDECILIEQDCYYKDLTHLSSSDRGKTNFDHPASLDFDLLTHHLRELRQNKRIDKPRYNFHTHIREMGYNTLQPANLVIVEGILLFSVPEIRDLLDLKIYIDTDDDIRIMRRIERDIRERGRDFESVCSQYLSTVKPMHRQYVEQSKQYADIIIPGDADNTKVIELIMSGLRKAIQDDNGLFSWPVN